MRSVALSGNTFTRSPGQSQLDQIVINNREAALSTSDAALLDFVIKLAMRAPWLSREDIELLRDSGFNDESILEPILVNIIDHMSESHTYPKKRPLCRGRRSGGDSEGGSQGELNQAPAWQALID